MLSAKQLLQSTLAAARQRAARLAGYITVVFPPPSGKFAGKRFDGIQQPHPKESFRRKYTVELEFRHSSQLLGATAQK
jgi:hypothetical protein